MAVIPNFSGDAVRAPDGPGGGLPQAEILSRITTAFLRVVVDWADRDLWADERIETAVENGYPVELDVRERSLHGRTALVTLGDGPGRRSGSNLREKNAWRAVPGALAAFGVLFLATFGVRAIPDFRSRAVAWVAAWGSPGQSVAG